VIDENEKLEEQYKTWQDNFYYPAEQLLQMVFLI